MLERAVGKISEAEVGLVSRPTLPRRENAPDRRVGIRMTCAMAGVRMRSGSAPPRRRRLRRRRRASQRPTVSGRLTNSTPSAARTRPQMATGPMVSPKNGQAMSAVQGGTRKNMLATFAAAPRRIRT